MSEHSSNSAPRIPRNRDDNYTPDVIRERQQFVKDHTNSSLEHVSAMSFDPSVLAGNIENPLGVAQIPIGLAGPLVEMALLLEAAVLGGVLVRAHDPRAVKLAASATRPSSSAAHTCSRPSIPAFPAGVTLIPSIVNRLKPAGGWGITMVSIESLGLSMTPPW